MRKQDSPDVCDDGNRLVNRLNGIDVSAQEKSRKRLEQAIDQVELSKPDEYETGMLGLNEN